MLGKSSSTKLVVPHKHICTALGTAPTEAIVEPECSDELKLTREVNVVHCKKVKDQQTEIDRLANVEHENTDGKPHKWEKEFMIDLNVDAHDVTPKLLDYLFKLILSDCLCL